MLKRLVSGTIVVLLVASILTVSFRINLVKASGTIYIRTDGSIDPPAAPIATVDNVTYTFTGDIFDPVVVERNNTVVDGAGYTLTGSLGMNGITLVGRSNVTVRNMTIKDFDAGIWLDSSSNSTLCGNNVTENSYDGIHLSSSSNNTVSGNNVTNNYYGIWLGYWCSYNVLSGNNVVNHGVGIVLYPFSDNNVLSGNNVVNNIYGIELSSSSNNTLSGNNVTASSVDGIWLGGSSNNTLSGNNVTANNDVGIYLTSSDNNKFYHNNVINNGVQVYVQYSANVWDDGYPSGGNYWSDYAGVDFFSGPYQNETGSDSIGDISYTIDQDNTDRYPLMEPYLLTIVPRISDLSNVVVQAGENQAYFVYADPHRMTRAVATYDVASGSIIYGMCENVQNQGFDTAASWVSQDSSDRGRLLLSNKTVLMFGSHYPHWCVDYLQEHNMTPVSFTIPVEGGQEHMRFVNTATGVAIVDVLRSSVDFEHEDYFVMMTLMDENNNQVFILYGFDWKGTWGAGIYFRAIYSDITAYTNQYYVMHWVDSDGDGIPQSSEMTQVATG